MSKLDGNVSPFIAIAVAHHILQAGQIEPSSVKDESHTAGIARLVDSG